MWWSSLDASSVTASVTHALGLRRSPGGGPQELLNISLIGVTEDSHCPVASGGARRVNARPIVDDDSVLDDAVRRFISDSMDA
jgi:hypothetical protein